MVPPSAPSRPTANTSVVSGPAQSPLGLDLSNIERPADERPRRGLNGSHLRLERQNATIESPTHNTSVSDASLIEAIDRNTSQLREMFGDLSRHVNEIERRIDQSEKTPDSDAE